MQETLKIFYMTKKKHEAICKKKFRHKQNNNSYSSCIPLSSDFENLGIESEKNNTVTQKDLEDIDKFLKTNIPKLKFKDFKKIQAKLKEIIIPDVNTVPMRGLTRDIEQQLMSSTEEQSIILNSILENNSKIFVTGPAGSGKTVLAVDAARNFSKDDKKVLFLCYNQNLGKYLKIFYKII